MQSTHMMTRRVLLAGGLATALPVLLKSGGARAQQVAVSQIVDALLPEKAGPVSRSMIKRNATRGINIEGELPPDLDLPSINLTINFDFNSARLTNDGMLSLRSLGQALADKRLAGMTFQIAGHTDDVGTVEYNQELSERRAKAVVSHLVSFYSIPADRLKPVGYGKSRLIVPSDPKAAANRRVEIINLQPLTS